MYRLSLACARFTLRVMRACRESGVFYSVENPLSSSLWKWGPMSRAIRWSDTCSFVYDNCRFGCPWLKPTRIITNLPELDVLGLRCNGGHTHIPLRGQVRVNGKWTWRTSLAGAYPPGLCWSWAKVLAAVAPKAGWRDGKDSLLSPQWQFDLCSACGIQAPKQPQGIPRCPCRFSLPWPRGAPEWGTEPKPSPAKRPRTEKRSR